MTTLCIGIGVVVILIETVFWRVFKAKAEGILFPKVHDHSHFRFFTIGRMRLVAALHTLTLLFLLLLVALFPW